MPTIAERFQAETGREKEPVETYSDLDGQTLFTLVHDLYTGRGISSSAIDRIENSLPGNCLFFLVKDEKYLHPDNLELIPIETIKETIRNDSACIFRQQLYINRKINELGYTLFCTSLGYDRNNNEIAGGVIYSNNWNWSGLNEEKLYGFLGGIRRFYDAFSGSRIAADFAKNKSAFRYAVNPADGEIIMSCPPERGGPKIPDEEISRLVTEQLIPAIISNTENDQEYNLLKRHFKNLQISKLNLLGFEFILLSFQPRLADISFSCKNDRLISNFSHQLRGKLGAIRTAASQLSLQEGHIIDHDDITLLTIIESAIKRCDGMISRLNQYAEGNSQMNDNIDLNELLEEIIRERLAELEYPPRLGLALDPELPSLTGDRSKLKTALRELVTNAIEACPPTGEIAATTSIRDESVSVRIRNNLTPDARINAAVAAPDPAQPFISWKSGHAGMGLTIAERIISEHGGELKIEIEPDNLFHVTLLLPIKARIKTTSDE
ncbi:MAG: hypothetical protein CVT49_15330 [candidate division Zixibacteria bacterium HGW-Zixibacteria-1]|nr:MAG: hypothetical protein CVT49_15330 [candidate division Zixibacteria bacterium HGW-Zixibacteria-1]